MQIKADEAAFADREKKREARKTLVKTNEGKAKKAYNDLVAANAKANKTEQDNFNAEEKKINAEKSSVALAKRALFEAFEKKPERVVQYVRINNPSSYLQLAEVEVYNQAGVNVALHQSTRQSSTGWGGVSSRAVDGNTDGHWSKQTTTHTQKGGWWEVNLGQPRAVSEVKVYNRKDCCAARLKGSTLEFLDKNRKPVLKKFTLSGTTNVQVFKVKGKCTC